MLGLHQIGARPNDIGKRRADATRNDTSIRA